MKGDEADLPSDVENLARLLEPLGSPTRLALLRFLTRAHYLEEVATHLGITRQAARRHLDRLVEIGVVERRAGTRESGSVTEYVVDPRALFAIHDEFQSIGALRREEAPTLLHPTEPRADPVRRQSPSLEPRFVVVHGFDAGRTMPVRLAAGAEWTVGRDARCDLSLEYDPFVSNRHAVVKRGGGGLRLVDLRSTNGTFHNLARVERGGEVALRHGDLVGVGRTSLLFWEPSP